MKSYSVSYRFFVYNFRYIVLDCLEIFLYFMFYSNFIVVILIVILL